MFDEKGAFARQFTRVDGGYLFYPSRKDGGKLVTVEEFERLLAGWRRVAGRSGRWKTVGVLVVAIASWMIVARALALPPWTHRVVIFGCAVAVSWRLLWASLAARRLVRDRPAVAPPRPASQAGREARAVLNWPFIVVALLLSGAVFLSHLISPDRTPEDWAWLIGSGLMLAACLWVGFWKLRDRQR